MAGLSAKGVSLIYRRLKKMGYLQEVRWILTSNDSKHTWSLVTQIIYKRGDGMTPEDQITKQPGRDKNDPSIAEPKAKEIEKSAKLKALPRTCYKPPVMAMEIGTHEPCRPPIGSGKFLNFDVFR